MKKIRKKAFTLIELIVVITILAILWTIAFMSFIWYSVTSRDSLRISDIKTMKTWLELYHLQVWKYPEPSNGTDITYSWWVVWTQWTFWSSVIRKVSKLNEKPTDPLTGVEYTYSLLNTKQEHELAWTMEWDLVGLTNTIEKTNADWTKDWTAYVDWNYNARVARVVSWWITYLLALPTIISSDITDITVENIVNNKKLVFKWFSNLPSSYSWTVFKINWESNLNLMNVLEVYSWSSIPTSWSWLIDLLTNLKQAYSWTDLSSNLDYSSIISLDLDDLEEMSEMWWNILKEDLWQDVDFEALKEELSLLIISWSETGSWSESWTWSEVQQLTNFSITSILSADISTVYSWSVVINWIESWSLSASIDNWTLYKNWWNVWTSTTVVNGDTLKIELTSSALVWTTVSSFLTIWTSSASFIISTLWEYDIYVSKSWDDTSWDWSKNNPYKTIAKAITSSSNSWSIYVGGWEYNESIAINKTWLQLIWEDPETTTITSGGSQVILVFAQSITIKNFNLVSTWTFVINHATGWDGTKIINNKIVWWTIWIMASSSSYWKYLEIVNNTIVWASSDWLYLYNNDTIKKLINNVIVNNWGYWVYIQTTSGTLWLTWYNLISNNTTWNVNVNYTVWTWDQIWADPLFVSWTYKLEAWSPAIDAWTWTIADYGIDSILGATWSLDTWVIDLWYHWEY